MATETKQNVVHHQGYFRWRALAALLDYGIFFGVSSAISISLAQRPTTATKLKAGLGTLPLVGLWLVWFPVAETVVGRTFGKWAADLCVVNLSNQPISAGQAVVRHLFDSIDLSFFGLVGYFVARSNPGRQRVGYLVAKTLVVAEPGKDSAPAA
jgi:uncharacterized RDD family membrane protein YckC